MDFNLSGLVSPETNEKKGESVKVLILGSGPAGLAAALYAARAELTPLVLTGMELGGQAALTSTIENYPGFPNGVGGSELGDLFQKQAERFGARTEFDSATKVDLSKRPFQIDTYSKRYFSDTLIIATGASPNQLNIPGEKELTGHGVSYCATCDGWFFKEKKVVVIGGGDSALEEALFLTRFATSVTIIHRRETFRAGAILQRRAKENPKIHFLLNSVVTEVVGGQLVEGVKVRHVISGEYSFLPIEGVFIFIGHTPNTTLFEGQLEMDDGKYLLVDQTLQASVAGVYVAGEAADPHYRQVITSAGMGAAAAIEVTRYLEHHST
jgi:thioredoxin reductase (NADPH)